MLLNGRYAPISVSVAPIFVGGKLRRLLESQLIVDECWAVACGPDRRYDRRLLLRAPLLTVVAAAAGATALVRLVA